MRSEGTWAAPVGGRDCCPVGYPEWVAFDNNSGRLPTGTYVGQVYAHSGQQLPPQVPAQFVAGYTTLSTSDYNLRQPVIPGPQWLVDVRDVYLRAGTTYVFTISGALQGFYLLRSSADNPGSWTANKAKAVAAIVLPDNPSGVVQTGSTYYTAPQSGWYGAVFDNAGAWQVPDSIQILGF